MADRPFTGKVIDAAFPDAMHVHLYDDGRFMVCYEDYAISGEVERFGST